MLYFAFVLEAQRTKGALDELIPSAEPRSAGADGLTLLAPRDDHASERALQEIEIELVARSEETVEAHNVSRQRPSRDPSSVTVWFPS